ncbi:MAG: ATP-binding protein [Lachnospiraceae bacterium]|nr:ATP-binding protein [Lachnospiraceae bacterium]
MQKTFNVTGICVPERNYMVDVSDRVERIVEDYVSPGKYFTMNRARQYGKTTMLYLLEKRLKESFIVLRLSFEAADEYFVSPALLAEGLTMDIADCLRRQSIEERIIRAWEEPVSERFPMRSLGVKITNLCKACKKKVVLMIDEVDRSSDNQIFFLSLVFFAQSIWIRRPDGTPLFGQSSWQGYTI